MLQTPLPDLLPLPYHHFDACLQGSLLTSMTDGPLLTGLHLGPRLSLRLQASLGGMGMPRVACSVARLGATGRVQTDQPCNRQFATCNSLLSSLCSS